jgi:molecular chaperone IbpA
VGFDRLFDMLEAQTGGDAVDGYPSFDIVATGEDRYRITLAVPGYASSDIEIVARLNELTVTGKRDDSGDRGDYVHRGIAVRPFERRFQLADFVEVESASLQDGLLAIGLRRVVPEAMKPRRIEIGAEPAPGRIASASRENSDAM